MREKLIDRGLRSDIKIFADTGIFEFEARKARTDLSRLMETQPRLEISDIFYAYRLMDPDFLVAPDEIILLEDDPEVRKEKILKMKQYLIATIDEFPKKKIYATLQGINEDEIRDFVNYIDFKKIQYIARGGLLPLRKSDRQVYYDTLKTSERLVRRIL